MKTIGTGKSLKQWLAALIIVAAIIMLFVPWINISIQIWGDTYDLTDLMYEMDVPIDDIAEIAENFAGMIDREDSRYTIKLFKDKLGVLTDTLEDSRLTPFELASTVCAVHSMTSHMHECMEAEYNSWGYYDEDSLDALKSFNSSLLLMGILFWAFIAVIVLAAVWAIINVLRKDNGSALPFTIAYSVYFIGLILLVRICNSKVGIALEEAVGFDLFYKRSFLHLTVAPYFGFVFSLAAVLVPKFMKGKPIDKLRSTISDSISDVKTLSGWECSCGKKNSSTANFCASCGQKKVDRTKCECGATIRRGSSFCTACGAPVKYKPVEPICPNCGKKVKPDTKFCTACGQELDKHRPSDESTEPVKTEYKEPEAAKEALKEIDWYN